MFAKKSINFFMAVLMIAVALLGATVSPAAAQSPDDYKEYNSIMELCSHDDPETTPYTVIPANLTLGQNPPEGCQSEGWSFDANGGKQLTNGSWDELVEVANIAGTVFYTPDDAQGETAEPAPDGDAETPEAINGWVHNPALPEPAGYPGLVNDYVHPGQQSDSNPMQWEITAESNMIFIIDGDYGMIPPVGEVGGQYGCYLAIGRGPAVWSSQPKAGEWPMIEVPMRSSWELHEVNASANPLTWAAQKAHDLAKAYPQTCGEGIDLWIYNGYAEILTDGNGTDGSSVTFNLEPFTPDAYQDEADAAAPAENAPAEEAPAAPANQADDQNDGDFVEVESWADLIEGGLDHFMIVDGSTRIPSSLDEADGLWTVEADGEAVVEVEPTEMMVEYIEDLGASEEATVWYIPLKGDDDFVRVNSLDELIETPEDRYLIVTDETDLDEDMEYDGTFTLEKNGRDIVDDGDLDEVIEEVEDFDSNDYATLWFVPTDDDTAPAGDEDADEADANEGGLLSAIPAWVISLLQWGLICLVGLLILAAAIAILVWIVRKVADAARSDETRTVVREREPVVETRRTTVIDHDLDPLA